jgi:hypothetical protein
VSGIQEILVLVIIILAIFFLPRMMNKQTAQKMAEPAFVLTGKLRLAIAASVIWPALMAAFLRPWQKDLALFLYIGIGPVFLAWAIFWVFTGFRNRMR